MGVAAHFAQSYAEARAKFLGAAEAAGMDVVSHVHPLLGRDGETLATDVARDGAADAAGLLIISSACHGVEGYCGSGVQNALLADPTFHAEVQRCGVAVLYVHGLNPYGFSWLRRTTHENVDLNRNFQDFDKPLPHNKAYDKLAHLLVPAIWPPTPEVKAGIATFVAEHGRRPSRPRYQAASTNTRRACSMADATPPGASRRCATCCATTAGAARGSAGSTCTRAWGRAATANASSPAPTTAQRWAGHAPGGANR